MPMPNFLILGTAKAGTTAVFQYLGQHPEIFISPRKETNFFALEGQTPDFKGPGDDTRINRDSITDLGSYQSLFEARTTERVLGEASPLYLYSPAAPHRIKGYLPEGKLIVILRNPVDRAYASFLHLVRDQREPLADFFQALQEESSRIERNWEHIWHYRQMGYYSDQLGRYFNLFRRSQIKIILYEEFLHSPRIILFDLFKFLTVDSQFEPDLSIRPNVSGIPSSRKLHNFLAQPNWFKESIKAFLPTQTRKRLKFRVMNQNLQKPKMASEARTFLQNSFREEIEKLQDLIQRDLSAWKVE